MDRAPGIAALFSMTLLTEPVPCLFSSKNLMPWKRVYGYIFAGQGMNLLGIVLVRHDLDIGDVLDAVATLDVGRTQQMHGKVHLLVPVCMRVVIEWR